MNAIARPPRLAGRGARVEGVTEASLTSHVSVACLFQHSWRGLAGLSPSAFSDGVRKP